MATTSLDRIESLKEISSEDSGRGQSLEFRVQDSEFRAQGSVNGNDGDHGNGYGNDHDNGSSAPVAVAERTR
jgi:hypothetical protein